MGCGYELPIEGAFAWRHQGFDTGKPDERGKGEREPTTCPGYTTKLPEVLEGAEAFFEVKQMNVQRKRSAPLLTVMKVIAAEVSALESWALNQKPGGG